MLFTARNGATISARIWSAVNPASPRTPKLPGIVITNGSVQADEQMYWYAAQALAKDGYIVMTFDPQGQGQSDTFGQAPDEQEGFPAQSDGRPFFDGTEDAINFFLSNPKHPYEPVPSCETGTSHAAKQNERVEKGLDAPYNPFWAEVKGGGIGLAGHSYGAAGVSYIAQWDPRVKAVVAWDNLAAPDPNQPTGASGGGPGGEAVPLEPGRPHRPADHQARPGHVGRLLPAAHAQHGTAEPAGQVHRVPRLQRSGRRQRPDHHPRRLAPRLQLHPQPGLRRLAARRG